MASKIIVSENTKILHNFPFLNLFVYLLPILINERSHSTLFAFEKRSTEHILRSKYGFTASTALSRKF